MAAAGVLLLATAAFCSCCFVGALDVDIAVSEKRCEADAEDEGEAVMGVVLSAVFVVDVVNGCPTDAMSRRSRGRLLCCCD